MRKLLILLYVATLAAPSTGCCGRIRNLFHRGAPCGTAAVAPAMLGGPLAVPNTMASGPIMSGPVCSEPCVPCESVGVPCENYGDCRGYMDECYEGAPMSGWTGASYNGGYDVGSAGCVECANGGVPVYDGAANGESAGQVVLPRPVPEN